MVSHTLRHPRPRTRTDPQTGNIQTRRTPYLYRLRSHDAADKGRAFVLVSVWTTVPYPPQSASQTRAWCLSQKNMQCFRLDHMAHFFTNTLHMSPANTVARHAARDREAHDRARCDALEEAG